MQPEVKAHERAERTALIVAWAVLLGLGGGLLLAVLTALVSRYGPSADSWSLKGNGALFVPLGIGPAIVCGAWTALVLHSARRSRWWQMGVGAGLVGTGLIGLGIAKLFLVGIAGGWFDAATILAAWVWTVAAPLAAVVVTRGSQRDVPWYVAAGLVFVLAMEGCFLVAQALGV